MSENPLKQIMTAGRGNYLSTQSQSYDDMIQPYILLIGKLIEQLKIKDNPPQNRKKRRAELRKKSK